MLPAKRQARIIEHLRRERFASLPALAELAGVSVSTVRRDVDLLCEQGHLYRTHGGAALQENEGTTIEPVPEISSEIARDAKQAIGRHAAARIEPGQSVILDSGITTMAVARAAMARGIAFSAITNDVAIAAVLARSSQIDVHVPGGQLRPRSATLLGAVCLKALSQLHVDLAFVGAHAVSLEGASETSTEHAEIKRAIMQAAQHSLLVADSGKFPARSLCLFASLEAFDTVLVDDGLDETLAGEWTARGIALERLS